MKFTTRSVKIGLSLVTAIVSIFGLAVFANNPHFSIVPDTLTGKLHCEYQFGMIINPEGSWYNAFENTIQFQSWYVLVTPVSINTNIFNGVTSHFITWSLYRAWWTMLPGTYSTATITWLLFNFKTLQNITSTQLIFTTLTGWSITFDPNTTDDGIVLNSSINSFDILQSVNTGTYTFVPLPCIFDTTPPSIWWNYPTNGLRFVPYNSTITLVLYDRVGSQIWWSDPRMTHNNNTEHYRYSWNDTSNIANYVPVPTSWPKVDNQEGVNSWTISLTIACPTCSWWAGWSYTFIPGSPSLTITERTWTNTINMLTRQNKIRWYFLSLTAPAPYEIEKQVYVYRTGIDNPNPDGNIHTGHWSFSFNAPQNPTITRIQPSTSSNIPTTFSWFVFNFEDDRAGVDTGTISITIPEYHSWTKFYTGHTYSWNELTITLIGWSPGTGNSWSYQVAFNTLRPFPSNATIQITWFVKDLAGNIWTYIGSFTTAMSCEDRGCADYFTVNIFTGFNAWSFHFTGTLIQVTGTVIWSPYPYLTGIYNDTLMCGRPYSWTLLTGNIWIYDTSGIQINGYLYTGNILYITGLDGLNFIYDNGTIIIQ